MHFYAIVVVITFIGNRYGNNFKENKGNLTIFMIYRRKIGLTQPPFFAIMFEAFGKVTKSITREEI